MRQPASKLEPIGSRRLLVTRYIKSEAGFCKNACAMLAVLCYCLEKRGCVEKDWLCYFVIATASYNEDEDCRWVAAEERQEKMRFFTIVK